MVLRYGYTYVGLSFSRRYMQSYVMFLSPASVTVDVPYILPLILCIFENSIFDDDDIDYTLFVRRYPRFVILYVLTVFPDAATMLSSSKCAQSMLSSMEDTSPVLYWNW